MDSMVDMRRKLYQALNMEPMTPEEIAHKAKIDHFFAREVLNKLGREKKIKKTVRSVKKKYFNIGYRQKYQPTNYWSYFVDEEKERNVLLDSLKTYGKNKRKLNNISREDQIIEFIKECGGWVKARDLIDKFKIDECTVHNRMRNMVAKNKVIFEKTQEKCLVNMQGKTYYSTRTFLKWKLPENIIEKNIIEK